MSAALVQTAPGSLKSQNNVSPVTTNPAHFTSNTQLGNLLVAICAAGSYHDGNPPPLPTLSAPVTAGLTWILAGVIRGDSSNIGFHSPYFDTTVIAIYYVPNAPVVLSSTTTTLTCSLASVVSVQATTVSLRLVEWSGVDMSLTPIILTARGVNTVPNAGSLALASASLLLVSECDTGGGTWGGSFHGSGFTTLTGTGIDEATEYVLNAGPATYNATFTGASASGYDWACIAVAFGATLAGGGGGFGTGGSLICSNPCSGPHLLSVIPGFSDLPDWVLW